MKNLVKIYGKNENHLYLQVLYITIYKYIIVAEDFEPTITQKHPNYFVYELLVESKEVVHK